MPAALAVAAVLSLCVFTVTSSFAGDISDAMPDTSLEVMTFNIRFDQHNGVSTDGRNSWLRNDGEHRRDLVLDVIRDADPDILGVQEALIHQVDDLTAGLPAYGFYGIGRNDGEAAGEFSGIYFRADRFTATDQGSFWLSNTPDVPGSVFPGAAVTRIASWIQLDDNATGQPLFVLNTHWDHVSQAARDHSAAQVRTFVEDLPETVPVIVMGDLNVGEDNPAFQTLLVGERAEARPLRDSYRVAFPVRGIREGTYNAFNGASFGARVDHILHSEHFETVDAAIVRTNFNGRYPSDHYPVTVTLRPVPEPAAAAAMGAGALALRRR